MRLATEDKDLRVVAVNDLVSVENLGMLLSFDSIHGKFNHHVETHGTKLVIDGRETKVFSRRNPVMLPWRRLKVDAVIEATGRFRSARTAGLHRLAGAKKVVITANPFNRPNKKIPIIIYGVNEGSYTGESVISASSCSANCAGPIVKVLHDNYGIQSGFLTAIHAYTRDQAILDAGHPRDFRRGRAAACNIVPSKSDAASIISECVPGIEGKIDGMTIRVPVPDGSLMNIICKVEKPASKEAINALVKEKVVTELTNILAFSEEPLVSKDVVNDTHSAVFDSFLTLTMFDSEVQVFCWFDHEWGYAARVLDLVKLIVYK